MYKLINQQNLKERMYKLYLLKKIHTNIPQYLKVKFPGSASGACF